MSATDTTDTTTPTRVPSATRRLVTSELRLMLREPMTVTFVFAFPVLTMLVIGGAFGTEPDEVFPVNPSHYYVAAYLATVIASTGLIMVPVHLASYRERGVLRRFAASGFPRWSFALSQVVVGVVATALGMATLLLVAEPVYGVPTVEDPLRVVAGVVAGTLLFLALGTVIGSLVSSARSAQALGLLLFLPSFLLGGGGPPTAVMSPALADVAAWVPLSLVTDAIRDPWLGTGDGTGDLVVVCCLAVVALALSARRSLI